MKKQFILLAYPKTGADVRGMSVSLPLSVLSLAGVLKHEYKVAIYDHRVDPIDQYRQYLDRKPLLVGISAMTGPQITYGLDLSKEAKERGLITVWGGVHPSLYPEQTAAHPFIDHVVVGEGESSIYFLAHNVAHRVDVPRISKSEYIDMDFLPEIPYDLVNIEDYISNRTTVGNRSLSFIFSRGCPYNCAFCCNPVLSGRKWRMMSAGEAAKRLLWMVTKYKLDGVVFFDENFPVGRAEALMGIFDGDVKWKAQVRADVLASSNVSLKSLESLGLAMVGVGCESGSERILEMVHKDTKPETYIAANRRLANTSIRPAYNWMLGFPSETYEEMLQTVSLALRMLDENPNAICNSFYSYVPYPGTELGGKIGYFWPDCLEAWADYNRHHYKTPWIEPYKTQMRRIVLSSKFVGRKLSSMFPDDGLVATMTEILTEKWRERDFESDEWKRLEIAMQDILDGLFAGV